MRGSIMTSMSSTSPGFHVRVIFEYPMSQPTGELNAIGMLKILSICDDAWNLLRHHRDRGEKLKSRRINRERWFSFEGFVDRSKSSLKPLHRRPQEFTEHARAGTFQLPRASGCSLALQRA